MKAILMLDEMPSNCLKCPFADECCIATQKLVDDDIWEAKDIEDYGIRPEWCPLKPMPKPKPIGDIEEIIWDNDTEVGYNCGWNACLEELEG